MPLLKLLRPRYRNKNRVFYQYYYSKRDLKKILSADGFEVLEWFYKDLFHTSDKRVGICLEFPFLRKKNGLTWELNSFGTVLAKLSEYISDGIFSSMVVFLGRRREAKA